MGLFRGAVDPDFVLMDDNAGLHRAPMVDDFMETEHIACMDWPNCSSDLNPIEHIWDTLGRRVASRDHPPISPGRASCSAERMGIIASK